MRLNEKTVEQSVALYDSLMENALACFTSSKPTRQMEEALKKNILDLSQAVCRLIARYVLYLDVTESQRRKRLSSMGLNPRDHSPAFGRDQWVASILALIILFMFTSVVLPGKQPFSQNFMYSILFAIQLGMAVIAGTVVAQRFIRRQEDSTGRFPPLAELTISALVVAGLCIVLRISWPLILDLINTGTISLAQSLMQFRDRWPFVLVPFICTLSIGLTCAYLSTLSWGWLRLSVLGGLFNAASFAFAAFLVGRLLTEEFLVKLQATAEAARLVMSGTLSVSGFVLGVIVLAIFPRTIRSKPSLGIFESSHRSLTKVESGADEAADAVGQVTHGAGPRAAMKELGGYSRTSVEDLEGRYVCFRPVFANPTIINAYEVAIYWDERRACLIFEERNRPDTSHSQVGQVYIPDGRPFMSLLTVDKGAVRAIMVTRPDHVGFARGLILTLSNPGGMHFVPATAPVVLRRASESLPQLGFVHPDSPDYPLYLSELGSVSPDFATLASIEPRVVVASSSAA